MKGTLFTLAGLAGTKEGEGGDQEETVEEHGWGWEHQPMLLCCAGRTGQLKEGTAASAEQHTGRPGQLACPEDTLVQLCRLPKAIWLTRTYLARQVTIMSARLPQPTLALSAKPPNSTLQPPLSLC